jgi:hypothetical protein
VIVSPSGVATMLDKYGGVFEAVEGPDGSFSINSKPRAYLGPGRPLGAGFNADGDLYVCDALKVGSGGGSCGFSGCEWVQVQVGLSRGDRLLPAAPATPPPWSLTVPDGSTDRQSPRCF